MLTKGSRRSREAIDAAYAEQRGGAPPTEPGRGQLILTAAFGVFGAAVALLWAIGGGDDDTVARVIFVLLGLTWAVRGGAAARKLSRRRPRPRD